MTNFECQMSNDGVGQSGKAMGCDLSPSRIPRGFLEGDKFRSKATSCLRGVALRIKIQNVAAFRAAASASDVVRGIAATKSERSVTTGG